MENLDLSPAKWIWWPSERTLPNTVVLFRHSFDLLVEPSVVKGWICADSRYRLWVNGVAVQWGPAPSDPRHLEADPLDSLPLVKGRNTIAIEVLHFGLGDGTWPFGKPGLIFNLMVDSVNVVTDEGWKCLVDRGRPPGQHRRSYLRAWQEVHDFRLSPAGWTRGDFVDEKWRQARVIDALPSRSPIASSYNDFQNDTWMVDQASSTLRKRSIPMMESDLIELKSSLESFVLSWDGPFDDWFDFRTPGLFKPSPTQITNLIPPQESNQSTAVTYDIWVEKIGFPVVEIDAPEGTIVEVICHESKAPHQALLDTHFFSWSRFVCREGNNKFHALDYEAVKFLQLHVRGNTRPVTIKSVRIEARQAHFHHQADIHVSDPVLQKVIDANLQTVRNSCQDNVVDGMGRERQQYSGDCGHQLHVSRLLFGDPHHSARFLRTFVLGQISSGIWCDSWPATDRLNRLWQKEMGLSYWGPIVDHSIGFLTDHVNHAVETGDLTPLNENWPSIERFLEFCRVHADKDGLLPAEGIGACTVWIDHVAFHSQSERVAALNLYLAYALQRLALLREHERAELTRWSKKIVREVQNRYGQQGLVWARKPVGNDSGWLDDRSQSTMCLMRDDKAALKVLEDKGSNFGESYPANAYWPYRVRAEQGSLARLFQEVKDKWATMVSVQKNGTIQEFWTVEEGTAALLSHCAVAPLAAVIWGLFGLHASLHEGQYSINPRLGGLDHWEGTIYLGSYALHIRAWKEGGNGKAEILAPAKFSGTVRRDGVKLDQGSKSLISIPLD